MSFFNTTKLLDGRFDKDNSSVNSFAISLGINTGIMLILITTFLVLRAIKVYFNSTFSILLDSLPS